MLVEGEAGTRLGTVEIEPHEPARTLDLAAMRPVVRLARDTDLRVEEDTLSREHNAQRLCVTRIRERDLPMKLVTVDYTYDGRKAIFYFIAENRVDFRDLVRDLANTLRVRVEMKQIGARDEIEGDRRNRTVRARAMLLVVVARFRSGHRQNGARSGPRAQSVAAGRHVRPPQVLPALRIRDLCRTQAGTARPRQARESVQGDGKVICARTSSSRPS